MKIFFYFLLITVPFHAVSRTPINVLSWWGYLPRTELTRIELSCNVKFSIDEYYSNGEFLRRWDPKNKSHNIIIYSKTVYELIKDTLPKNKANLNTNYYHPTLRKRISELSLNQSTRVFMLSLTGFLWDSKNIDIHKSLSLEEMIQKSNRKIVLVVDDAVEGLELFKSMNLMNNENEKNISERVKKTNTQIFIANEADEIIEHKNFAFAYLWSGDAFRKMRLSKKNLKFTIHPSLSQVTLDMVSATDLSRETSCVLEEFSSQKFLSNLQNETYYFSPYGDLPRDPVFREFYQANFPNLQQLPWIKSPQPAKFFKIDDTWKRLKLHFNKQ